ncbi:MAG: hypothetical protein JXQ91_07655 [Vannielia sp.]|uniref:hypothetical protein n=1 Tax=Vannielia sp. TaxID=2813045 RepID=UPI003B8D92D0
MPETKPGSSTQQDISAHPEGAAPLSQQQLAARAPRNRRPSPQMRKVCELMAHEGLSLPQAAKRAEITRDSAVRAFHKANVKTYFNQLVAEIRANAAQQAYLRINHIGQTANSETVKLDANKWVAGVDGIAAVKRIEGRHSVNHTFGGFDFTDAMQDVTPEDDGHTD